MCTVSILGEKRRDAFTGLSIFYEYQTARRSPFRDGSTVGRGGLDYGQATKLMERGLIRIGTLVSPWHRTARGPGLGDHRGWALAALAQDLSDVA
jgi:hypothetical protein